MSTLLSFDDLKNARRTVEDFVLSYFPLYHLQLPQEFLRYCHVFVYLEGLLYKLDRQNEQFCSQAGAATIDLNAVRAFLQEQGLLNPSVEAMLQQGEDYWTLERSIVQRLASSPYGEELTVEQVHECSRLKSFDYRVLHEVLLQLYEKDRNPALLEYLTVDEELLDLGDDLVDYEDDVLENAYNIYRCYLYLYGGDAQLNLASRISDLEQKRGQLFARLNDSLQQTIHERQTEAGKTPGSEKWIFPEPIWDEEAYREAFK